MKDIKEQSFMEQLPIWARWALVIPAVLGVTAIITGAMFWLLTQL